MRQTLFYAISSALLAPQPHYDFRTALWIFAGINMHTLCEICSPNAVCLCFLTRLAASNNAVIFVIVGSRQKYGEGN